MGGVAAASDAAAWSSLRFFFLVIMAWALSMALSMMRAVRAASAFFSCLVAFRREVA